MKVYTDDKIPKKETKPPSQRIAEDVSIIRAWVRFFGVTTVIGWFIFFIYLVSI